MLQNLIAGKATASSSEETLALVDPASGEEYGRSPISNKDDVDLAMSEAKKAFEDWRLTTPGERSEMLLALADTLEEHVDEIIDAEVQSTGKPYTWMRESEFPAILDNLRFFAAAARCLQGFAAGSYVLGYESLVRREPLGVCAQVSPWNYPLHMAIWKVGPAIAAGNTVVVKPAETTPVTAVLMGRLAAEHFPPGVLNVIVGDRDTGRLMVAHDTPSMVSVTGSERAGKEVASAASATLKRVHLELGGKAPAVVFEDADVDLTVEGIMEAAFLNAGQDCEAACRVLVHQSRYSEFVDRLIESAGKLKVGPPSEGDADFGPLNSSTQLERVHGYIQRLPAHARVLTGGEPLANRGGFFYPPTVVVDVQQRDEIVQEEVFGPVVTVQVFQTDDEALEKANDVRFGLASSIWTNDNARILRFSRDLDYGKVWVNTHLVHAAEMPNNGIKASGYGNDISVLGVAEYTRVKHVLTRSGESL